MIIILFVGILAVASPVSALPIVTEDMGTVTDAELAADLFDPLLAVSNFAYGGDPGAAGLFDGATEFEFNSGIVLSSGYIGHIIGPNLSDGVSAAYSLPGDVDLNLLIGNVTNDASSVEFDVAVTMNYLVFHYMFGSEEYNEYVGMYNDAFGFFVDGVNYAVFSNGEPVCINNINLDYNERLYNNNDLSDLLFAPYDTEMDGFSEAMYAVAPVTPGTTVHVKIVVADAIDGILDTHVLVEKNSFTETDSPPGLPQYLESSSANPSVSTRPLASLYLKKANDFWSCIAGYLPDDVDAELSAMIDDVEESMSQAITLTANPIYTSGVLIQALNLMEMIAEELDCPCYLDR